VAALLAAAEWAAWGGGAANNKAEAEAEDTGDAWWVGLSGAAIPTLCPA
jgi:hypothetical protein